MLLPYFYSKILATTAARFLPKNVYRFFLQLFIGYIYIYGL